MNSNDIPGAQQAWHSTTSSRRHCLVTITDDGFVAGTQMLLFTFLRYNPWFRGTVVVIVGGELGAAARARLQALTPICFVEPGADLVHRVAQLTRALPGLRVAGPRFASLEAFGMDAFDRVVYIDSDAFVTGDLSRLFMTDEPLLCCGDGSHYDALLGDPEAALQANRRRYGKALSTCFNAGMISIGRACLARALRDELVGLIDPQTWRDVETLGWTDQLILNRRFAGFATLLDARYNYMPILEARIRKADGLSFCDARVIHMAGRDKPWETPSTERPPSVAKFHELWQQLSELMPGQDARASEERLALESAQMHSLMQPRTEIEASS
ncbi:glycosyltransferase [Tahibacter amnicola]|uniref:Glycosyl transferase family 8 n=1 Tax=Tahibacter amnicola TaxID=2976241 RepID=A0ABY6BJQ7_9GAMM|nr:glycosyltransferase [Tahibacter amnicola]UXI70095.1 hypothetical protein N4264_10840 [Tahibacter amnicola]